MQGLQGKKGGKIKEKILKSNLPKKKKMNSNFPWLRQRGPVSRFPAHPFISFSPPSSREAPRPSPRCRMVL